MPWYLTLAIVLVVITAVVFGMRRLARYAGKRGWVYNQWNPRPPGGGTLGLLESIYQPSIEHVIEERASEKHRGSQDESGDKPEAGFRRD